MDEQTRDRAEHVRVILEPAGTACEPGAMTLWVTTNGVQWVEQMTLTPEERDQVWALLDQERRQRMEG